MSTPPPPSIAAKSATQGLYIGIYLIVLATLSGMSMAFPVASVIVLAASVFLPFFTYRLLRESAASTGFKVSFAELWAEGIGSYFLAAVLLAAYVYIMLRFVFPDFMQQQLDFVLDALNNGAGTQNPELARLLEATPVPTAVQTAAQAITANITLGALISLIAAACVSVRYSNESRRQAFLNRRNGK